MKAVVVHALGDESVLRYEEAPDPQPGARQVLIRVKAASINRGDLDRRAGRYWVPLDPPFIVGWDVAGLVEAAGAEVTQVKPGDRVVAIIPNGGYAEKAVAPRGAVVLLPESVSFEEAAALPVAYLTAWYALLRTAQLKEGETVLIQAGASGVGCACIQIARSRNARVWATAGGAEKLAFCKRMGAEHAIDYQEEDFVETVMRRSEGRGVDVVVDSVGGDVLVRSVQCLARGGRLVSVGHTVKAAALIDGQLLLNRELQLFGLQMGRRADTAPVLAEIVQAVARGLFRPAIDRAFPLAEAAAAHRYVAARRNLGKVLLIP